MTAVCRERELRKKERMEKEMKELKETLEHRAREIKARQGMVAQGEDQISKLEQMLKEQVGVAHEGEPPGGARRTATAGSRRTHTPRPLCERGAAR
jgi:predicted  nucleic acid-binding Zn-ribbon protein